MTTNLDRSMIALALAALLAGCDDSSSSADAADDAGVEEGAVDVPVDVPDVEPDLPDMLVDDRDYPLEVPDVPDVEPDVPDVEPDVDDVPDILPDGEPLFAGILCGWGICGAGEVCCVTADPVAEECTAAGACSGDFVLTCDGSEDCAEGERCCMPSGALMQTTCFAACPSGFAMCHDAAECDDGDPATFDYCHPSMCLYPMFERGTVCVHSRNENCINAVDDDGDTLTDVDDPDCATFPC